MRRLSLTLLAASLLLAVGTASAADHDTTIPAGAVRTAEQLRDRALQDNTGYQIVTSLTTEIGPRLAGGVNDQRARLGDSEIQGTRFRQGLHRTGDVPVVGAP